MQVRNVLTGVVVGLVLLSSRPVFAQVDMSRVSDANLEALLPKMGIRFNKQEVKGSTLYTFERNNHKIQLANIGGRTLLLQAVFAEAPLSTINAWNVQATFSRGVLYTMNGRSFSAVEMGLDCQGGVNLGTVERFIHVFDNEVARFDNFLRQGSGAPSTLPR